MARYTSVKAARQSKRERRCYRCARSIEVGQPYFTADFKTGRSGFTRDWCADHTPRPSEMTQSEYRSAAYAVQESIEDFLSTSGWELQDLVTELESAAESVRNDIVDALHDSAGNFENGGGIAEELEDRASQFDDWASSLDTAASEVEGLIEELGDDPSEEATEEAREAAQRLADDASMECPE